MALLGLKVRLSKGVKLSKGSGCSGVRVSLSSGEGLNPSYSRHASTVGARVDTGYPRVATALCVPQCGGVVTQSAAAG